MKNSMLSIQGLKNLDKKSQSLLKGGSQQTNGCQRGCYKNYLVDVNGEWCAVPDNNGGVCYGTVRNDQCCI